MGDLGGAASILQRALDEVGGSENLAALLRGAEGASGALQHVGGADSVAEAVLIVSEAVVPNQAFEVAEAIESFGGPFAIARALDAASGSFEVSEAIAAAGGALEIAQALSAPGRVVLAQALMGGGGLGGQQ